MGSATSLVIFAIGSVMRLAVTVHTHGFNVHTIGVILMVVGAVGFVLSLFFWPSWGGFGSCSRSRRTVRVSNGSVVEEERGAQL